MRKYVLPVLIWMSLLKGVVVAVYLAGSPSEMAVGPRDIPKEATASVPVPAAESGPYPHPGTSPDP